MKIARNRKFIIIALAVLGISLIAYGAAHPSKKRLPDFTPARERDVVEEVFATGKVVSKDIVKIAFEQSGKVVEDRVSTGKRVLEGDLMARLDGDELYYKALEQRSLKDAAEGALLQAESALDAEKTRLKELQRGARKEEIALGETKVANADETLKDAEYSLSVLKNQRAVDEAKAREDETAARANHALLEQKAAVDLANIYNDTNDIVNDSYAKANDAIRNQIDALWRDDATANPRLTFTSSLIQLVINLEQERINVEAALNAMQKDLSANYSKEEEQDELVTRTKNNLDVIRAFLIDLYKATDAASGISEPTIMSYQTSVNNATNTINAGVAAINNHTQQISLQKTVNAVAIQSSENALNAAREARKTLSASYETKIAAANADIQKSRAAYDSASNELALTIAPATEEKLGMQFTLVKEREGAVSQAQARLMGEEARIKEAEKAYEKTILRSPINGVITIDEIQLGEIVFPTTPLVSILGDAPYQIEAFIPEIDIVKLEIGDAAQITFDSYGADAIFTAEIIAIDTAETALEGVSTYKTTFVLSEEGARVKPGMTANLTLVTDKREDVIAIQERLVKTENGKRSIRVITENGKILERFVTTGLRGSDGYVEVITGIDEGEKVVIANE